MKVIDTIDTNITAPDKNQIEQYVDLDTTKNILLLGTEGSGKTQYAQTLAKELHLLGVELIVIDPKGEYDSIAKLRGTRAFKLSSEHPLNILLPYTPTVPRGDVLDKLGKDLVIFDLSIFENDRQKAGVTYFLMQQICTYVGSNIEKEKMLIIEGADTMLNDQETASSFFSIIQYAKAYNLNILATIKNVSAFLQNDWGKSITQAVDDIVLFKQTLEGTQLLEKTLPIQKDILKELENLSVGKYYSIILASKTTPKG